MLPNVFVWGVLNHLSLLMSSADKHCGQYTALPGGLLLSNTCKSHSLRLWELLSCWKHSAKHVRPGFSAQAWLGAKRHRNTAVAGALALRRRAAKRELLPCRDHNTPPAVQVGMLQSSLYTKNCLPSVQLQCIYMERTTSAEHDFGSRMV